MKTTTTLRTLIAAALFGTLSAGAREQTDSELAEIICARLFAAGGPCGVDRRQGQAGQDSNDRHHGQHLDQRKALSRAARTLHVAANPRKCCFPSHFVASWNGYRRFSPHA